ncbi:unnamed protein product [Orchesella dallaii]|uniref:Lysosome membrane protein 2 n=1 Tax=Orchesella dallaii TaxID=48710 RepID=A0ABP1RV68_9HEXA
MDLKLELESDVMMNTNTSNNFVGKVKNRKVVHNATGSFLFILVMTTLIIALAIGFGWVVVPAGIKFAISTKAVISPDVNPDLYSAWIQPHVPVFLKVFLFNVTNPEDIKRGSPPIFKEIGPYVFLENRTKLNIQHYEETDTISYEEKINYNFQQTLSGNLELKDEITLVNIPFAPTVANGFISKGSLEQLQRTSFITRTVEEALFKGWVVQFLKKIEEDIGISLVDKNEFGILMQQNNTATGPYTVGRGTTDKSLFGKILKIGNNSKLDFWKEGSPCNEIDGTDGSIYPPFVNTDSVLRIYNADLCRSIYLTYNKSTNFEGIHGYHFTVPQSVLAAPTLSEENRCFCSYVEDEPERCIKRGALDLGPCREGAPIAISAPHFLDADPQYVADSGLVPDRTKHKTFIEIEPTTGIVINASKRIQINLILKRLKGIPAFSEVPELLFPLVWVDEVSFKNNLRHCQYQYSTLQII